MKPADARGRLRALATLTAKIDGGRVANRLSAYALLIEERPEQREEMHADLEALAGRTQNPSLAELLYEACAVVRAVLEP